MYLCICNALYGSMELAALTFRHAHCPGLSALALALVSCLLSTSRPQVYDWIAGAKLVVPPSHYMSREEAMFSFPKLKEKVSGQTSPP